MKSMTSLPTVNLFAGHHSLVVKLNRASSAICDRARPDCRGSKNETSQNRELRCQVCVGVPALLLV